MKEKYFGLSTRIAKWKKDTPFENWLSYKADHSEFWKKLYVLYYRIFDSKYYKGGLKYIRQMLDLHSAEFVNYDEKAIKRDMIYSLHRYGISFEEYCILELAGTDCEYKNSFVSDKLRYYYCDILNDRSVHYLMTDKYECYKRFKKLYKRTVVQCKTDDDERTFKEFAAKNKRFIFKPLCENSGHGIKMVSLEENEYSKFFKENLANGPFVVEELIKQGHAINVFHPQSINTLRVVTFVIGNKVTIPFIFWRLGIGNSCVDNCGSGGLMARIEPSTGLVTNAAQDYFGKRFEYHPDTKQRIKGFQMPQWDEAISFIKEMALTVKGATFICWDLAYSEDGWCMVEGNENGALHILQKVDNRGYKKILFSLMDEFFKYKENNR